MVRLGSWVCQLLSRDPQPFIKYTQAIKLRTELNDPLKWTSDIAKSLVVLVSALWVQKSPFGPGCVS